MNSGSSSLPGVRGAPVPAGPPDLELDAPAKVNLFLEVLARRPDGYHEIETVMQAVDLCDRISFWRREPGELSISVAGGDAPADGSNLALRAAELVLESAGVREGLHLHIEKRIPSGGGLGGGSSDAGAVLVGLNRLWRLGSGVADLEKLGAQLGSDVNFFLHGGTALCRGRGEVVEPLDVRLEAGILLYLPGVHVSTADVYRGMIVPLTDGLRSGTRFAERLCRGDLDVVGSGLFNRLEETVFRVHPQLASAKERLIGARALGALLSGSGSTLYALAAPGDLEGLATEVSKALRRDDLRPVRPVSGWEWNSAVWG